MFDEQREEPQFEEELEGKFREVMVNNVVARRAYDAAKACDMNEELRLKAAIIQLAEANKRTTMAEVDLAAQSIVIGRAEYVACKLMLEAEELRKRGLLAGGPEINQKKMNTLVQAAEGLGMKEPTKEEIDEFVDYMAYGGRFESEPSMSD